MINQFLNFFKKNTRGKKVFLQGEYEGISTHGIIIGVDHVVRERKRESGCKKTALPSTPSHPKIACQAWDTSRASQFGFFVALRLSVNCLVPIRIPSRWLTNQIWLNFDNLAFCSEISRAQFEMREFY